MSNVENSYYRLDQLPPVQRPDGWVGKGQILRKDSDEAVDWFSVSAPTPDEAKDRLAAAGADRLTRLGTPTDWGRDKIPPNLIARFLKLNDELYGLKVKTENAAPFAASSIRQEAESKEAKELDGLRQEVNALPEPQKISLIAPAPYQVEKHMNPNILDVLGAKQTMYELIEAPSEAVQLAFADLMKVLNS